VTPTAQRTPGVGVSRRDRGMVAGVTPRRVISRDALLVLMLRLHSVQQPSTEATVTERQRSPPVILLSSYVAITTFCPCLRWVTTEGSQTKHVRAIGQLPSTAGRRKNGDTLPAGRLLTAHDAPHAVTVTSQASVTALRRALRGLPTKITVRALTAARCTALQRDIHEQTAWQAMMTH